MSKSPDSKQNKFAGLDENLSPDVQENSTSEKSDSEGEILSSKKNEMEGEELTIRVGPKIKNRRLDVYLCARFCKFSRTHIQRLIKEQGVKVNSKYAKASTKLNPKDIVELVVPPKSIQSIIPEDIPLDIIYEDDDIIVINKQADIIVHPARGNKSGTLVNALVYYSRELSRVSGNFRPGIVHRLDRNTTGVMIVAKTDEAHLKLARQFAERTTQKTYLAVVHGVPELTADRINQPIGVNMSFREKMAVTEGGKDAVTFYRVMEEYRGYSLMELKPRTGRTHQIRVHMQYLRHPIVADTMYGGKVVYPWQIEDREAAPEDPLMNRVALHAWRLEIKHPASGRIMTLQADPPPDLQRLIDNLRKFRAKDI